MSRAGRSNFAPIWRFEVSHQLRKPTTWFFALLYIAMPMIGLQASADPSKFINAPLSMMEAIFFTSLYGLFASAALMGDAATRDDASGIETLFFTAPVSKLEYLAGRFVGALTVQWLLTLGAFIGLGVGQLVPFEQVKTFGPFQLGAYIQPIVMILWPLTFVAGAAFYAVAAITRRLLPMYISAIAGFIAFIIVAEQLQNSTSRAVTSLFDPFGFTPIRLALEYVTRAERNTHLIGYPGLLIANRLAWIGLACLVLAVLYRRFKFEKRVDLGGFFPWITSKRVTEPAGVAPANAELLAAAHTRGRMEGRAWRQVRAVSRRAMADTFGSWLFILIVIAAVFVSVVFGLQVGSVVFDTSTWPVTHLMASEALSNIGRLFVCILISIYAGELVWRDRDTGMQAITAAAPVPEWVTLAGKALALVVMLLVLQAIFMLTGIGVQTAQGYHHYEIALYLKLLFGFALVNYLLFAAAAVTLHVVIDHKALGHLAVIGLFVFPIAATPVFKLRHHLLIYGTDPGWVYSDLNGFGPFLPGWFWFKVYWAGWALLLALLATLFWTRVGGVPLRTRIKLARERFTRPLRRVAFVGATIIAGSGSWIFYNTNVRHEFFGRFELRARRADYERQYKRYENAPQPTIIAADLRVELHPERRAAELTGSFHLVNRNAEPVAIVLVDLEGDLKARTVGFDRPAQLTHSDSRFSLRIYELDAPLAPGDSMLLNFDLAFEPRGFPNSGINTSIAENGAYFSREWLPYIGYQPRTELSDSASRVAEGLPPRDAPPAIEDTDAVQSRTVHGDADHVHVDAIIGTANDQIVVTPGRLLREWNENGRRYFHYRTDEPLPFGSPFLSARYAVRDTMWNDVALKIYSHPTHTQNLDRMMRAMSASLDYFTTEFGPYQAPELRIVEFPRYASFARAHPHTIAFSEGGAFLTRIDTLWDIDRPFFVVAHETAHQWWGHQVTAGRAEGGGMVSETLAQYSAMSVMAREFDERYMRRFFQFEMGYYLAGRASSPTPERSLLRVTDQGFVYYRKGSVAMWTLRDRLGEARVNAALKSFLEKYRGRREPPYATSLALYNELKAVAPDSLHPLMRDLFEEVTIWDLATDSATYEQLPDSTYRVTMHINAKKTYSDTLGVAHEVPLDEWIEVGVFAADVNDPAADWVRGEAYYLQPHRIRSGRQTITAIVRSKPMRAGVDPNRRFIDRRGNDNVVTPRPLDENSAGPPG